mmetsp:Transcript_18243/g.21020  ORF Transcript_18243/g.21020 Transcript_18243/m.21020 type:complete len:182 (-) Transcript_18243:88-633(-)
MYSKCSQQYWSDRKQRSGTALRFVFVFMAATVSLAIFAVSLHSSRRDDNHQGRKLEPRLHPNPTEGQTKKCKEHFRSIQNDCSIICNEERHSIPRQTMHQACMHGCNIAYKQASEIACSGGTNDDLFNKVEVFSFNHCSKFQNVLPKPEVFSLCRKYHTLALDKGFTLGQHYLLDQIIDFD